VGERDEVIVDGYVKALKYIIESVLLDAVQVVCPAFFLFLAINLLSLTSLTISESCRNGKTSLLL